MDNIEIGSDEWKVIRRRMITASDAPAIMGVSPWCTREKLMEKKVCGIETPINAAMQRGLNLEEEARALFEKDIGELVFPKFKIHEKLDWLAATFDGINDKGTVVEIKCPGENDHNLAIFGQIPMNYVPQLAVQMIVAEVDEMWYVSYRPENHRPYVKIRVPRYTSYDMDLLDKLAEFHEEMKEKTAADYGMRELIGTDNAELRYIQLMADKKVIEMELEAIKKSLIAKCDERKSKGRFLTFIPVKCKGTVDYSAIPELEGVDLEVYRKAGSIRWTIDQI